MSAVPGMNGAGVPLREACVQSIMGLLRHHALNVPAPAPPQGEGADNTSLTPDLNVSSGSNNATQAIAGTEPALEVEDVTTDEEFDEDQTAAMDADEINAQENGKVYQRPQPQRIKKSAKAKPAAGGKIGSLVRNKGKDAVKGNEKPANSEKKDA